MIKLVYGNEPYCINAEKKRIKGESNEMDLQILQEWTKECSMIALQMPFFAAKRTIILEVEKLGVEEELLEYLKKPCIYTDLFIFANRVEKNTKVYKELKKNYDIEEYNKVSSDIMQKWLFKQLKAHNTQISKSAYETFLRRVRYWDDEDCNLYVVKNYLLQMMALTSEITEKVVCEMIPATVDEKIFALSGYILEKRHKKAFTAAVGLLAEKEQPIAMLSAMHRILRLAFKASLYKDVKGKDRDVLFGAPAYQYIAATKYESAVLKSCMEDIQYAVNQIKSGYPGDKMFLWCLAVLCQKLV